MHLHPSYARVRTTIRARAADCRVAERDEMCALVARARVGCAGTDL
jgi:hypothetical protein